MTLINNTDSLIKRYSEAICRIHTMLSRLNTSSNQRGFNMYCISYIKSMLLKLQCNDAFQSTKEQPFTMLPTGVFIDSKTRTYGLPTVQLPDGSASCLTKLRPATWSQMRPATWSQNETCDLVANVTSDLVCALMKVVAQSRFRERRLSCL